MNLYKTFLSAFPCSAGEWPQVPGAFESVSCTCLEDRRAVHWPSPPNRARSAPPCLSLKNCGERAITLALWGMLLPVAGGVHGASDHAAGQIPFYLTTLAWNSESR